MSVDLEDLSARLVRSIADELLRVVIGVLDTTKDGNATQQKIAFDATAIALRKVEAWLVLERKSRMGR